MTTRWASRKVLRVLAVVALVLAAAGITVAATRRGESTCTTLHHRLTALEHEHRAVPQRWQDIAELQDYEAARGRAYGDLVAHDCT